MNITENFFTLLPAYLSRKVKQGCYTEKDFHKVLVDFAKASKQEIEDEIFILDFIDDIPDNS